MLGQQARDHSFAGDADGMSASLLKRYQNTRKYSLAACEPLIIEDYNLQAETFTSPPKWHLAHTCWFFETFLLKPFKPGYKSPNEAYEVLFNSYYNGVGEQFPRHKRGLLSRPQLSEILEYRRIVDAAIEQLLLDEQHPQRHTILQRCRLGIEHEQQHQELFFTDLKYSLSINPLNPCFLSAELEAEAQPQALNWLEFSGGVQDIGYPGNDFCFDNELPRHQVIIQPFKLASRLVTNADYQQFVDDGGYRRPELWLADGWLALQQEKWQQPLYWRETNGQALEYTLHGIQPRNGDWPVCHISGYEAEAYARWSATRLPTEMEWEHAATCMANSPPARQPDTSHKSIYHPQRAESSDGLQQLYSDVWQWTRSAYTPYPGFSTAAGAIGEYNGKFMSNQWVLRGGSCVSSPEHLRPSYRNFFYPQDRWQFSGLRLAQSI
jgi:ergothioneine biosynthesis protein EgtB